MNCFDNQATSLSGETWFHKALRCRVYDPDEALHIGATHHRRAAESRSRGGGWEIRAERHDEMAAICEAHAATLIPRTGGVVP